MASNQRVVLIAGPTASGKSALGLQMAKALDGAIVNADSMQVYRDLSVLTARPDSSDETGLPHHLFGHRDGAEGFSVAGWLADVQKVLMQLESDDRPAVFVGGTGLYFKALTEGLSPVPDIPDDIRAGLRHRMATDGVAPLYAELEARDPVTAQDISSADGQRTLRALEVLDATGRPLSAWRNEPQRVRAPVDATTAIKLVLAPDRRWLEGRIRARAETMLKAGALEEVRVLLARGLSDALPVMRALGVATLSALLTGEIDQRAAIERMTIETRRYAKRQETWFRNQMEDWRRVDPAKLPSIEALLAI